MYADVFYFLLITCGPLVLMPCACVKLGHHWKPLIEQKKSARETSNIIKKIRETRYVTTKRDLIDSTTIRVSKRFSM